MPEALAENWLALMLAGIVAFVAIALMFAASFIISSKRKSDIKETPYECGIPAAPYAFSQINIRYYIFAILFLIFDVEAVFLFPWAVVVHGQQHRLLRYDDFPGSIVLCHPLRVEERSSRMAEVMKPNSGNVPGPSLLNKGMPGVITAHSEQLFAMARKSSLWAMTFGPGLLRHRDDVHVHGPSRFRPVRRSALAFAPTVRT